jgi:hypothetical protein
MSVPVPPHPPLPPQRLEEARTIDDVLRNIEQIIDWSIRAQSTIGYFAVLYKRATVAVRQALNEGKFNDGPRMEKFDVVFAGRYFNAFNAYFYPGVYDYMTLSWDVALVGHADSQATMIQQMMAGLNAHICYDLGTTAVAIAPNSLDTLQHDFNLINALVATQIPGMLDEVQKLSPALRWIRRLIPNKGEVWLIRRLLIKFRTAAWYFASYLATHPEKAKEERVNHSAWTAALGAWYLQPPARWTPFPLLVRVIAKRESKDVAGNIRALGGISNSPEKLNEAFLGPIWARSRRGARWRRSPGRAARRAPVRRAG